MLEKKLRWMLENYGKFWILLLAAYLTSPLFLDASIWEELCQNHHIFLEPEVYHVKRTRALGSHQKGVLYGAKMGYNRIKNDGFYWELNTSFGEGRLHGKNGIDETLKSNFSDFNAEGRLGYTIEFTRWNCASFTPYVGYGYFEQTNHFVSPSPLPVKFRDAFHFASLGFLSEILHVRSFTLGVNFQTKFMIDAKCKVTGDPEPEYNNLFLPIGNKTVYEVEIPVNYCLCWKEHLWNLGIIPFYELRQYGGHESYPFDFLRTKIEVYGARLSIDLQF